VACSAHPLISHVAVSYLRIQERGFKVLFVSADTDKQDLKS
jgi:hypothetical protein